MVAIPTRASASRARRRRGRIRVGPCRRSLRERNSVSRNALASGWFSSGWFGEPAASALPLSLRSTVCHAARSAAAKSRSQYRKPRREYSSGYSGWRSACICSASRKIASASARRPAWCRGVGTDRVRAAHLPKCIAAAVGVGHAALGVPHRPGHLAQRQLQLAQVAGARMAAFFPVLLLDAHLQPSPHRLEGLGQPAQGAQAEGGFVQ
jgi:hypothetical protein